MISNAEIDEAGLHLVVGLSGLELSERERALLAALRPAGVILFACNIEKTCASWPDRLRALIEDVKRACGRRGLLVSIDHEGGRVHRLCAPATHFPAAALWKGRAGDVGRAFGRELRELGVNLCFAPVADVRIEPQNKVIGERAFSESPEEAGRLAVKFLAALQSEGVLGCGKHFPGHGATVADSHFDLPVVHASLDQIRRRELVPFRALIRAGLKLIMTAHVVYPEIDSAAPATLSPALIQGLLREELGFSGPVISDALEMGALKGIAPREKAVRSLNAGVDLLLVAQPTSGDPVGDAVELAEGIRQGVRNGAIAPETLEQSRSRIKELLTVAETLHVYPEGCSFLGCREHAALASELASG